MANTKTYKDDIYEIFYFRRRRKEVQHISTMISTRLKLWLIDFITLHRIKAAENPYETLLFKYEMT